MKFSIVKYRYVWFAISASAVGLSILAFAVWGLKQGIDFTGGSEMSLRFASMPSPIEVEAKLAPLNLGELIIQPAGEADVNIRAKTLEEATHQQVVKTLNDAFGGVTELQYNSVGPAVGVELRQKSVQALFVAFVLIMAYIAWQFRKVSAPVQSWKYGIITVMQAFRDIMIPIGVFSVLGHFYGVEVGMPFIAAILTVLGYSITDCIVVLDRVRENLQKRSGSFEEIVEKSIHQTILRSFNTSMATLLTLFAIFFFGGSSLHDFTLALIIGISVGTFSSIFVSAPTLVSWYDLANRLRKQ